MPYFIGTLLGWLAKFLAWSYRLQFINLHHLKSARAKSKHQNFIFAFWHEHLLSITCAHRGEGFYAMISQSKDGDLVSRIAEIMGQHPVRGSSSRGGSKARGEMITKLNEKIFMSFNK